MILASSLGLFAINSDFFVEPAGAHATRAFAGGDGSLGDPFQISDIDQLQDMGSDLSAHYVLINDIDATDTVGWNSGEGFEPVGDSTHKFTGSLDGQDHEVTDLFINRTISYVGLIGYISEGASLSNISMIKSDMSGNYHTGGLVGSNYGTVKNCYSSGIVTGMKHDVGGLVGYNGGSISNSHSTCNVNGMNFIGGLAGMNEEGHISNSSASGNVYGVDAIGGLVGNLCYYATIKDCYATGNISGSGRMFGGLVGEVYYGTISNSHATGHISGGYDLGGLVGQFYIGTLSDCYAIGNIDGILDLGGLAGYLESTVATDCYSTGDVTGTGDMVGGLIGNVYHATVSNCTSSGNVAGDDEVGGFVGYFQESMISNCSAIGTVNGSGSAIGGLVGLNNEGSVNNCSAYGDVFGNEYVGGLVGSNDGLVQNCSASGEVSGSDSCIGGLVGYDSDTISNSYATGRVSGPDDVGGLVGYNNAGPVLNSYATGDVMGTAGRIGGLVGENNGLVSDSYAIGNTSGVTQVGGLVGYNSGSVERGFWDTETSGIVTSDGGIGKTTVQMKQVGTFTKGGWNLIDVWSIFDGKTYPYLKNLTYSAPIVTGVDLTTAQEDLIYQVSYSAKTSLPGCTEFTWEIVTEANWLTIDAFGVLSGIPSNDDVGIHEVVLICKDPRMVPTHRTFDIEVQNTNDAPEINLTILNAIEDSSYSLPLSAIDIDPTDDVLTWALESGPTWLVLNTTNNTLIGTPLNSDVGPHDVNVSVSDGLGGSDWEAFTVIVENTNDDPIIKITPKNSTLQDDLYSVILNATDEDPVPINLTWTLNTNADWLTVEGNYLNGTPGNLDVGSFWVNITVIDGNDGSHFLNYTLVVTNLNDAPQWASTPMDQILTEGEEMSIACEASDMDGDVVTYSIETTPSTETTIDPSTGVISWTSPVIGDYAATITATDGTLEVQYTFSINVYAQGEEPEPVENLTDTDRDGMPDEWEETYGLDPEDPSDASLDLDDDGISNIDEYKNGSNPMIKEPAEESTDDEDKGSFVGFALITGIILILILIIIVAIVVISRKNRSDLDEE